MNQIAPLTHSPAPPSGAAAMIPRNMRDAMEMANMMAKTGFLAKEIQNVGGALFVMEQSMRWNMSPFAVAMETSFIQGKPMFSGKIVAAAVQGSGVLTGRLSYDYSGAGDDRTVTVRGTLRGEAEPREVAVRVRDARTQNKVWTTQTDQQLAYHGARVWARRHAPEVMLGVYSPEEFEPEAPREMRQVENLHREGQRSPEVSPGPTLAAEVAAAKATLPVIAPSGTLHQVPRERWLAAIGKAVGGLEDAMAMKGWSDAMSEHLGTARALDDALAHQAEQIIAGRIFELAGPPDAEPEPGAVEPEEVL
jgi:hypothetical protein